MTTLLIKTPYFGDRPYEVEFLQSLVPFTIKSIRQGSFELTVVVEETITQAQVDTVVAQLKNYVLANLITGEIVK